MNISSGGGAEGVGGAAGGGATVPQAASRPRIAAAVPFRNRLIEKKTAMWVILLEAFGALLLFVLIIWWTMFSGRNKGERPGHHDDEAGR
nr:hypothetical protein [uncultured Roseateles sp.]